MKFIYYLSKISGVGVFGLCSLLIFGIFFIAVLVWTFKADKKLIEEISNIPLN